MCQESKSIGRNREASINPAAATARPTFEGLEARQLMSASYQVVDLGIVADTTGNVGIDINNDGVVLNSKGVFLPGKKGKYAYFPAANAAGTKNPSVDAISDSGLIVGDAYFPATGDVNATLYSYSKSTAGYAALDLGNDGNGSSHAKGVNDLAQIVGTLVTDQPKSHAYLSSVKKGRVTYVDLQELLPTGVDFELRSAEAINNSSQMVVRAGKPGASTNGRTFLVKVTKKGMGYLELPPLDAKEGGASGYAINDQGVIVGSSSQPGFNAFHGVVWRATRKGVSSTDLGTLGGKKSRGFDINEAGTVVGFSDTKYGPDEAVVWTVGKKGKYVVTNLNDATDNAGLFIKYARGVNDQGWIVAEAVDANYKLHTVVLKPTGAAAKVAPATAQETPAVAPTAQSASPFATRSIAAAQQDDVLA